MPNPIAHSLAKGYFRLKAKVYNRPMENKYGGLPGDLPATLATQFGFAARGTGAGQGDGNGIIQGVYGAYGWVQGYGETATFWEDLSMAGLIDGQFNTASETTLPPADVTGSNLSLYFPAARIGGGNYVYVWSGAVTCCSPFVSSGINYFGVAAITSITVSSNGKAFSSKTISVQQAYNIDKKMDDGLPLSGIVTTVYINNDVLLTSGLDMLVNPTLPTQVAEGSGTCFDNGNVNGTTMQYSLGSTTANGSNLNCALSFKFQ
jgi:hypothetical protein